MNNHIKIVIPLYNVEKWIKTCIRSVKLQTHNNFQCIVIDDISTDGSVQVIKKEIENDDRFLLIVNEEKKYALKNIYDAIASSNSHDEDIIITLDGDDWFANKEVLSTIDRNYKEQSCWMTYGSYAEYPSKTRGKFAKKIPQHVIDSNSFREHEWCSSHLRTFKYHLWKKINKKDLINPKTNKFIKAAWDLAFMFPMLEMSGNKAIYIKDIMYIYNRDNPLNEDKVDHVKQINEENFIRTKSKYERIS